MSKDDWKNEERLKIDVLEVWNEVERLREDEVKDMVVQRNSRWKTIRIFVSSTFKDFHTERDALVKEIFPELRDWCQKRNLNLVECDLRWGVPEETPYCVTLQICLDEIRRCEQENKWPYFLNMISKRAGYIPIKDELPPELISDFNLVIGLSVTEMEIVEAAYRKGNSNSLFMWRDDGFMDQISDEAIRKEFLDELHPIAEKKLTVLKRQIRSRFPDEQIFNYICNYIPGKTLPNSSRTQLQLSPAFKEKVLNFFKKRIDEQYPFVVNTKQNEFEVVLDQQDAFMQQRASSIVGRDDIIKRVKDYIFGNSLKPIALIGEAGSGKSTLMAKVIFDVLKNDCSEEEKKNTLVFFHFVGAVPSSTGLLGIMRRLLHEMGQLNIPSKSSEILESVKRLLLKFHSESSKKIVIFIDALNQLDNEDFATKNVIYSWLPKNLPPKVKCIFSMVPDSPPLRILMDSPPNFQMEIVGDINDLTIKNDIVTKYLINFRKKLDTRQTLQLLNHSGSKNPLWLLTACEELRCYGEFKNLTEYIRDLPSTLDRLLLFVLRRICMDLEDKELFIGTLCLMECSKNGLLEVELLEMLAQLDTATNYMDNGVQGNSKVLPRLLSWKWGSIYRQLKNFVRPYGDSGEGRLDFYHRSMSKVVRENFLNEHHGDRTWKTTCHTMMAVYFETSLNINRKIEEYPYHLIELGDLKRLENFLVDWDVFEELYDSEWSRRLLEYWGRIDDQYSVMHERYAVMIGKFKKCKKLTTDELICRMEKVARVFSQSGLLKEALSLGLDCRERLVGLERQSPQEISEEVLENRRLLQMYISGFLGHLEVTLNRNYAKAVEYHDEAIKRTEGLKDQHSYSVKRYRALQFIKKAFCLGEQSAQMVGLLKKNARNKLREEARRLCNDAILIYREIEDYPHELEAQFTEASLSKHPEDCHKKYEGLIRSCCSVHGRDHGLITRALFNDGTEYEVEKDFDAAYRKFRAAYLHSKYLLGPGHSTTKHYMEVLQEQKYVKVGRKKEEDLETALFHPDDLL